MAVAVADFTRLSKVRSHASEPSGPACPICATIDDGPPDAYAVHTCRGCGVEFRPPRRLPVRGATVSKSDGTSMLPVPWNVSIAIAVVVGVIVSVLQSSGDRPSPYVIPPPAIEVPQLEIPRLDPAVLEALGPTTVTLEHEVHTQARVANSESTTWLHLTGLVRNPDAHRLDRVQIDVRLFDADDRLLVTRQAVVSCAQMAAMDECAWALDDSSPAAVARWDIEATGERGLVGLFPLIEARGQFDGGGQPLDTGEQLRLDLARETVTFLLMMPVRVLDGWASVTALDEHGQVVDVTFTRWHDLGLEPGSQTRSIALPNGDMASYDIRVGGVGGY